MTALLVGADRLGNIPNALTDYGFEDYIHWDGRKKKMRSLAIPTEVNMIIVFHDFIEHNITKIIKQKAKQMNIPCVFSRRSCSDMVYQLEKCGDCTLCKK
ncbi:DUF2325 domain-containing protein [Serpentinicella sp. ANB-PHB4]|uniref:DUF2325 domain-containing protein n=1 Tax=Serpentinicella sp. ANB-PHB4 TaxID=3074076 RepID=UPI002856DEAD|nr:DUF2325 domain-containing protein [Serpentinicella sp. ANB-PHB4]MDR5658788.1 DUF2325 domain-containing protein [Serpentinicella sp. ANB-PHB4]